MSFEFKSHRNGNYQPNSRISVGLKMFKVKQQSLFLKFLGAFNSFCRDKD